MNIDNFFPEEHIIILKNTEKQLVIKEMIDKMEELGKITSASRLYAQVAHRESLENTGLGHGLAIPHARTDSVKDLQTIFAISEKGIEYESFDKNPVKFLLLSIFPSTLSTKYLYLVGMIARIFSNIETRMALEKLTNTKKIYAQLKKETDIYFAGISLRKIDDDYNTGDLSGVPSSNLDLLIRLDRLYELLDKGDTSDILNSKINELRKLIDIKSLSYYEKMRKKCQNSFAILEKETCSGCHMGLAPNYLAHIKKSEDISVCNHCGRFLLIL